MSAIPRSLFFFTIVLFSCTGAVHAASAGNPVKGAELFQQCAACHAIGDGAENPVGPSLNHVFGRKAGTLAGYTYSEGLQKKAAEKDLLWHEETLYIFIAGPERYIPGTTMGFPGLRREKEIRDLLAFLIQYSPAYQPDSQQMPAEDAIAAATLPAPPGADDDIEEPDFSTSAMTSTSAITMGGDLWAKQCRHCHGNSAYPGKAPKLTPATYTAEFVFDRLTNGFRKMPAWKSVFTLEQRTAIVAYVLSDRFSP